MNPHTILKGRGDLPASPPLQSSGPPVGLATPERRAGPRTVGECMSAPVMVIEPHTPVLDAYNEMIHGGIRRLPVVDGGRLVGIVTLGDLREARPSPATSLSIYELNYLLSKLTVDRVMTHTPLTVTAEMRLTDAAALMLAHKVGGLPVVDPHGRPIGIITESDFFRLFATQWDALTAEPDPAPRPPEARNTDARWQRTTR
ncbi:MAG: CBS domain-containing protein [Actinomycetota bacterium]|nr:CBS domain-containing protein [Actinomycetota bacterium]